MLNTVERQKLIENWMNFADTVASNAKWKTPRYITIEELRSAAYLGLCDAASKAESFETFNPRIRIQGEITDYLRSLNWGTRSHHITASSAEPVNQGCYYQEIHNDLFDQIPKIVGENAGRILVEFYVEEKNLSEIAAREGKTKGRISQIMTKAREKLSQSPLMQAA